MPPPFTAADVRPPPLGAWLNRLRHGHYVWLAKERELAVIEFPLQCVNVHSKIGIWRTWNNSDQWGYQRLESWFIDSYGRGGDGTQLFLPVSDIPDDAVEPAVVPDMQRRQRRLRRVYD